jgi:hypothetical protein
VTLPLGRRHVDGDEAISGKEVVLAALVNNPQVAVALSFLVCARPASPKL